MDTIIRSATLQDAAAIATLSKQLGYERTIDETIAYLIMLNDSNDDSVRVAVVNDLVVGWIHTIYTLRLESGFFCEITGLVTDEAHRGKNIGKLLVASAIEWAKTKNCNVLKVRSNVKRKDAHRFYLNNGFTEIKEQKVFEMELNRD